MCKHTDITIAEFIIAAAASMASGAAILIWIVS